MEFPATSNHAAVPSYQHFFIPSMKNVEED
jgi:hypothetical protein